MPKNVTHNYTQKERRWGKDITYRPEKNGMILRGHLWSPINVRTQDYLLLSNGSSDTRYQVTEVEKMVDPPDMYKFEAEFAPRSERDA